MFFDASKTEELAREYKKVLGNAAVSADGEIPERITVLLEEQLALADLFPARSPQKRISYIKNLIFRSLNLLSELKGEARYLPPVNAGRPPQNSIPQRFFALQTDIYILLDKLEPSPGKAELQNAEDRKLALFLTLFVRAS